MCGIFGILADGNLPEHDLNSLALSARQRGRDSSGLIILEDDCYKVFKADYDIKKLLKPIHISNACLAFGHSRLITNGLKDNQPVIKDGAIILHNGIIVNSDAILDDIGQEKTSELDSEVLAVLVNKLIDEGVDINSIPEKILGYCQGVVACAILVPRIGKAFLFSNNGSLYTGHKNGHFYFSSELYPLTLIDCEDNEQVLQTGKIIDIPQISTEIDIHEDHVRTENLIPHLVQNQTEAAMLKYEQHDLQRCTKCILPSTMPYISFDGEGVCNYCNNYKPRNKPKPKKELFDLVEDYRREHGADCIVPFSGGRDSCYGLHLIVHELKMKPITYTYDWGMVTDLGRRNISRMCEKLNVENIIVADDISKKRRNIRYNLSAWLKSPHLGMMALLTAGDKHFFRHVETIKKQTGISLNLWGVNPLEVTHFKTGFLGIKPDFEEKRVYSHGAMKQLRYHYKRTLAMMESPGYFNRSLWDTLSGEYYRSFTEKTDYYHIFDYWRWDENTINDTLLGEYDWEKAPDTSTTWRIGDGTAALYNYVYYTVMGFTEHDTFRSNQIREGDITRDEALKLVEDENQPRYLNIKWYLDAVQMDYKDVISVINNIEPYSQ